MRIKSCSWVLRRLPLLDGGELAVDERRRVERHLIGCPDCRDRRSNASEALSALRSLAAAPARREAPSLWPVLERQIRQSRHAAPRPAWSWSWLIARASPALSFGLAVGGVMAVGFVLGRTTPGPVPAIDPSPALRVATGPDLTVHRLAKLPAKPQGAAREASPRAPKLMTLSDDPFRSPNIRVDYILDHGYPIGSGARDPQRSY
ncbi:zf-HC2 domain-containing protein [Tundrisphaera sp. TA3]|uniref:zf-HC2 domain-containing protein n=1 Tax=Tundrisphaera sp. TA3 TaxID=3435775 RepID=UPI003EBAA88A